MDLHNLLLTQDGFRHNLDEMVNMIDFVSSGGLFDKDSLEKHNPNRGSLIAITEFPDGSLYIRDGLHRAVSVYIARPIKCLFESEYKLEQMDYSMYTESAIEHGWYTPFDPRIEVRKSDFFNFKEHVLNLISENGDVESFIASNKQMYALKRTSDHTLHNISKNLIESYVKERN